MRTATLLALVLLAVSATAHLDAGLHEKIGSYTVDVGHMPAEPRAGESVSFAVHLLDDQENLITPDKVWLRIADEEIVHYAGNMRAQEGNLAFTYAFPQQGDYTLTIRWHNQSAQLTQIDYDLDVKGGGTSWKDGVILGLLVLVGLLLALRKK